MNYNKTYCGFVYIIGRSNVGKSTLLNKLLGNKISITSSRKQTTLQNIVGIYTYGVHQIIYIDTPGIYIQKQHSIDRTINKTITTTITNASLVIFVIQGTNWTIEDRIILNYLRNYKSSVILAINKIDILKEKAKLLPYLKFLTLQMNFAEILPISAKTGININSLIERIINLLPEGKHYFPENYRTTCSQRFIASEIIREKIIYFIGFEVPNSIIIEIENFSKNNRGGYNINGLLHVKNCNHKKILIGKKGEKIKIISIKARKDMQKVFKIPIYLRLWVKIRTNSERKKCMLNSLLL